VVTDYAAHYGLKEAPFRRNQHPKWLYLSAQQKEAIIKTRWMVEESGGLALWRADVGHGKSSLIEYVITAWRKQLGWNCAKLQNTGTISGPHTLLKEVHAAFGLESANTTRKMVAQLETWLLEQQLENGKPVVLFIDEAQSLSSRVFPVIRDLINLQTRDRILLQVVMAGQPAIDRKLKNFPALRSRIAAAATFRPFTHEECDGMLLYRFERAGAHDPFRIMNVRANRAVFEASQGIPRDIITIADAAMKEAFLRNADVIDAEHVRLGLLSLEGRSDYIPSFGDEDQGLSAGATALNRSALESLRQMREFACAG
jgi:type II secretory pathway predicted ATPase ExeA